MPAATSSPCSPAPLPSFLPERWTWRDALAVAACMIAVLGVFQLTQRTQPRSPVDFSASFFLLDGAQAWVFDRRFLCWVLCAGGFAFLHRQLRSWREFIPGSGLHYLAWTLIGVLAWTAALYPLNHLVGQAHLADRLIILGLAAASVFRPAFFPFFVFAALRSYQQWAATPLGDVEFTNRALILDLAQVLIAAGLVWPFVRRFLPRAQIGLLLAVACANLIHYWIPGVAKVQLGQHPLDWLRYTDLAQMMTATTFQGWNLLWDTDDLAPLYAWLVRFAWPMKVFVLALELGVLFAFASRRAFHLLNASRILLHLGILVCTGDFFWNWILVQLAFTAVFRAHHRASLGPAPLALSPYGWVPAGLTAAYIAAAAPLHRPQPLGWFDTPLVETYRFYAVLEDGRRLYVPSTFFAPHEFAFIQSQFHYVPRPPDHPSAKILVGTFGHNHSTATLLALQKAEDADAVRRVVEEHGRPAPFVDRRGRRAADFDKFIQAWWRHHATHSRPLAAVLQVLDPPQHAYSFSVYPPEQTYRGEPSVTRIEVEFLRAYFDGQTHQELARSVIHTIPLTPP
jgi:hypothetical protein